MSPTPGARRPCPRAYAPWLLSLAATLLLAVGAALAQWDLESILSRAEQRYGELGALGLAALLYLALLRLFPEPPCVYGPQGPRWVRAHGTRRAPAIATA
nr:hypothetical protein [Pseudomonas aeruginosa]